MSRVSLKATDCDSGQTTTADLQPLNDMIWFCRKATCYCHLLRTSAYKIKRTNDSLLMKLKIIIENARDVSKSKSLTDQQEKHFSDFTLKLQSLRLDLTVSGTFSLVILYRHSATFLATGLKKRRRRWMSFRWSFVVMRTKEKRQSLKDDSLSELVAATSWSSVPLTAPSGTGASGVSRRLGSNPSMIILFLMAICGTPT